MRTTCPFTVNTTLPANDDRPDPARSARTLSLAGSSGRLSCAPVVSGHTSPCVAESPVALTNISCHTNGMLVSLHVAPVYGLVHWHTPAPLHLLNSPLQPLAVLDVSATHDPATQMFVAQGELVAGQSALVGVCVHWPLRQVAVMQGPVGVHD